MSATVENLLLLARADADQIRTRKERVDLQALAIESFEQMEGFARRKKVALDITEMAETTVMGDPLWLTQIVTNLLNNALKYTPSGGRVEMALRADSGWARLSVSDTGPGIPA